MTATLTSDDLSARLLKTTCEVVRYDADGARIGLLSALQAFVLTNKSPHTGEARGKNGRVRSIRPIAQGKVLPWRPSWRTDGGAAALPTYGYDRRSPGGHRAATA